MSKSRKPTPKLERQLNRGCTLFKVGPKYRWKICHEAELLKEAYEENRKERPKYDAHFQ